MNEFCESVALLVSLDRISVPGLPSTVIPRGGWIHLPRGATVRLSVRVGSLRMCSFFEKAGLNSNEWRQADAIVPMPQPIICSMASNLAQKLGWETAIWHSVLA